MGFSFTVAYVLWLHCKVFAPSRQRVLIQPYKFIPYMDVVYLHLHKVHKRDFFCFSLRLFFLPLLDLQQMSLYLRANLVSFKADLLDCIFCPVCFLPPVDSCYISTSGASHYLKHFNSVPSCIFGSEFELVCPETRVKGLAPVDSFRFLAFILLL